MALLCAGYVAVESQFIGGIMFIGNLLIKNYRKFGNEGTRFSFQNYINIIVGENNSGKSALVDALWSVLSSE